MNKNNKLTRKKNVSNIISLLFGAIAGVVFGVLLFEYNFEKSWYEELMYPIILLVMFIIAFITQIIIHEAGHLVFGLMTGYKFSSFRIFSIMFVKESNIFKFKRLSLTGTAGQCLMSPPDMINGKLPVILYNLGGSLMNIIASVISIVLYFLCKDFHYFSLALLIFALVGFLCGILNGVPRSTDVVNNDGYNAVSLAKNKEAMQSFWVQLKVVEQTAKGVRIKDMPEEWFYIPTDESMKNSMVATQGVFACNKLMEEHKFDEADRLMKHMLQIDSGMVGIHRNMLICDRIYIELITDNRSDIINDMLTKEILNFRKSMKNYPIVIRTEYVLALLFDKNKSAAEMYKEKFEKCAKSYPYQNDIESERELIRIAESVYDEQISKVI